MSDKPVKYGKDNELEELANALLGEKPVRSVDRDFEKMSYEAGALSLEELEHYDPANDWDTQDSAFAILVNPSDLGNLEPSICADVPDGNVRIRNPREYERMALRRHLDDADGWGSAREDDVPALGVNEGPRKLCTRCRKPKARVFFSPDPRNKDGLYSWCRKCHLEYMRLTYERRGRRS